MSFPIVIRSLAGIPSIIQAAGRCNRNCEADYGTVYLWNLSEEILGRLPDIQKGGEICKNLLGGIENPNELGKPWMIDQYFAKEEAYTREVERYPYKEWNTDLVTMLSINSECRSEACLLYTSGPPKTWGEPCGTRYERCCGVMTAAPAETCCVPIVRGRGKYDE